MVILIVFICLCLGYVVWQYFELKKFGVTEYEIFSEKIQKEQRIVVIADLHGYEYGKKNQRLTSKVKEYRPDLILIAGDMIVSKYPETYGTALEILRQLIQVAPVYYSFGNHESRAAIQGLEVSGAFETYLKEVQALGVRVLRNEQKEVKSGTETLKIAGLEINLAFYEKGRAVPMEKDYVEAVLGKAEDGCCQILLAHNPMYSEQYAAWGADLTFCGHNHGGLVRIPGIGSIISPQLTFFPKYNDGLYEIKGKSVIVSRGLGTHTFHIRIFNRAELVAVRLFPKALEKNGTSD